MENYTQLAFRYLKLNRRRSLVTIVGVMVAVTVLYIILNLGCCYLVNMRKELREQQDYEIVLYTENQGQIEEILKDSNIKNAYVAPFYQYDYYGSTLYENALYLNTTRPYQMDKVLSHFKETYGVNGELNFSLALTYMQGGSGNSVYILILFVLLISFIMAIFGVGIIRNSIQLTNLEQIKDFGNLRCIGASKGQVRKVIYIQGAVLELAGMVLGIALGFFGCLILGLLYKWENIGFHILPIVPIAIAFFGDLYFAMDENCKQITNITPVSAIRGEYRIRKEKIRPRRRSLFRLIWGIEGDYAYKSIMRNPGRFVKTVVSLSLGIAATMTVFGVSSSLNDMLKTEQDKYGYYQIFFESIYRPTMGEEEIQGNLPPVDMLEQVGKLRGMEEAKRIYSSKLVITNPYAFYEKGTSQYRNETMEGSILYDALMPTKGEDWKDLYPGLYEELSSITCYGYDEGDMKRYGNALVDGTLQVSDHGVVLVNGGIAPKLNEYEEMEGYQHVTYTDYKVGDTVEFLDMALFREKMKVRAEEEKKLYEQEVEKIEAEYAGKEEEGASKQKALQDAELDYHLNVSKAYKELCEEMIQAGQVVTYTIEGIVKKDENRESPSPCFVFPLESYYRVTATDETVVSGMQYHFDRFSATAYYQIIDEGGYMLDACSQSWYPDMVYIIEGLRGYLLGGALFVLFVVVISIFNIINTTAGTLHMRRKELAQLRVIGISKEGLEKMVMLEGVIATLVAGFFGVLLGTGVSFGLVQGILAQLYGYSYKFPLIPALVALVVTALILCGSVYVPLKSLPNDLATDLKTAGE